jgi:hypothetical protein
MEFVVHACRQFPSIRTCACLGSQWKLFLHIVERLQIAGAKSEAIKQLAHDFIGSSVAGCWVCLCRAAFSLFCRSVSNQLALRASPAFFVPGFFMPAGVAMKCTVQSCVSVAVCYAGSQSSLHHSKR